MRNSLKDTFLIVSGFIGFVASIVTLISYPLFAENKKIWILALAAAVLFFVLILFLRFIQKKNKEISSLRNRLEFLEKERNVPFFKKWPLIYAHMWRSGTIRPDNPVILDLFEVKDEILPNGRLRDTKASFYFKGKFTDATWQFIVTIGGDENTSFDNLNFVVEDLRTNQRLNAKIADRGRDETIKDIIISFKNKKEKGDTFELQISWTWPKMLLELRDYISLPNVYSKSTHKAILSLQKTPEMKFNNVEAYKYGPQDNEPVFLRNVYADDANPDRYTLEIDQPEMNADYLLYYE